MIRLLFFSQCVDWLQCREMSLPLSAPSRLFSILSQIPKLSPLLEHRSVLKVAVNQNFSDFDTMVQDGDEVAFLPPFSGG
jgi:molybdopterin converting factor small subunit